MTKLSRILHVEDDPDIRDIVQICLETMAGFELRQCEGGAAALAQAEAFAPDLFLLDLMMPGLSGVETLRELRKIPALAHIPAVFCTSVSVSAEFTADLRELSIGAVQKPFDPMSIAGEIGVLWDTHNAAA